MPAFTDQDRAEADVRKLLRMYGSYKHAIFTARHLRDDPSAPDSKAHWSLVVKTLLALAKEKQSRNKSGGRVTYTVATIDPYTQRSTSRLGRQVSKREAMKVADMWESHGTQNVCVIDSRGIIHRQPSNHAVNRNRSGAQGRLVRFMPMATQWEQYSGWEGHAFADPSNDGYYHVTWRHHRDGMPTYIHAQHLSFKIRKFSKRFAA